MHQPTLRHWLYFVFLVGAWSSAIILTKVAVQELPPLWVTAGRIATGAIALIIYRFGFIRRPWSLTARHLPWVIWLALVSSALPFLLIAWGSQYTGSAIAGILMGTVPLLVLGLAHILLPDEKLTTQKLLGFIIGFIGVVLIIDPWAEETLSSGSSELIGQLAIVLAALCYALNSVSTRRMPSADNLDKATAVLAVAAIILISACLIQAPPANLHQVPNSHWAILTYLGLIPTALATVILFILLLETTAGFVAMSNYLIPAVTAFGGILFLSEELGSMVWLGFATILSGLAISSRKSASKAATSSD